MVDTFGHVSFVSSETLYTNQKAPSAFFFFFLFGNFSKALK